MLFVPNLLIVLKEEEVVVSMGSVRDKKSNVMRLKEKERIRHPC